MVRLMAYNGELALLQPLTPVAAVLFDIHKEYRCVIMKSFC